MTDIVPERASFWREALRELQTFVKAEWQWVAGFAAIIAMEQLLTFTNFDPNQMINSLKDVQGDYDKSMAIFVKFMPQIALSTAASLVTAALATYVFTVLYLRQFAQGHAPEMTAENFLYWLRKVIQKYWKLSWPMLLAILAYAGANVLKTSDGVMKVAASAVFLVSMVWIFYFYYGLYLYYLVTPLAVLHREHVLETSAQLTKVHLWRIWWGVVIMLVVLFLFFIVPFGVSAWAAQKFGDSSSEAQAATAVVQGLWRGVTYAALAVYACTVYRILLQEQKNASVSEIH